MTIQTLLSDRPTLAVLTGLAVIILYFAFAWWRVGRNPNSGPVIALFAPPPGMSAAGMRYVEQNGCDDTAFTATLVALAVKGILTIREDDYGDLKIYTVTRTAADYTAAGLTADEDATARALFAKKNEIELSAQDYRFVHGAQATLKNALTAQYGKGFLIKNWAWFRPLLAIAALSLIAMIALSHDPLTAVPTFVWSCMTLGTAVLLGGIDLFLWKNIASSGQRLFSLFGGLVMLAPTVCMVSVTYIVLYQGFDDVPRNAIMLFFVLMALVAVFHHLLLTFTPTGAKTMAQIDGFKLFLNATEADRLKTLNAPTITRAMYERFLPFAMALDCETPWTANFQAQAASVQPLNVGGYQPDWMAGKAFSDLGPALFKSSLGTSLANAQTISTHSNSDD
ncbi:MAG TPA: hypothetical protein VHW02_13585 [Rhizomicrobium sp.]|jgi:hypothetical protein|nr:hypothetical protein [Rhizomicrobium sp.]